MVRRRDLKFHIAHTLSRMAAIDNNARIGADVGGTFTDVILQRADGSATVRKLLSTPPNYDAAVVEAAAGLAAGTPVAAVVHGTTVATNAVLEHRGALTALVTTEGFRDVLELRRLRIPRMYEPFWRKPEPLVPRRLRFEVGERMAADGTVLRALDEGEAREVAALLRAAGVESIAICLLHSYLYPEHEERLGAILREELPDVAVSLSSEILREQREYERSATTVVNAYVRPLMDAYVGAIRRGLDDAGIDAPLTIMQSSGGVMTADDARLRPVLALESGPAAGVVAALAMARRLGFANAITFDMGGTTAKASLIEHGAVARGREYEVGGSLSAGSRLMRGSGELLRIPTIDIAEVGAGGGSVAWLDPAGGLQVGPRSAGAAPGPACYGRGGDEPTVTDANVFLGYIPEGPLADGQITVSQDLARGALDRVAAPLRLSTGDLAAGVHAIANARMTRALRSVSSEKGRDPREFALIAYGGAGPVHAVGLAEELGCTTVLVPALAGLFSSLGLLYARPEFHEVRTCQLDARTVEPAAIDRVFDELAERIDGIELVRTAELRYGGQTWEIEVAIAEPTDLQSVIAAFEDEHERLYGIRGEDASPIEIRALRLAALGLSHAVDRLRLDDVFTIRSTTRQTVLGELPVRTRASIGEAAEPGPMLIDEYDTTVVVRPGWTARRDAATETLVLERS
jgi:N-methylhydantoinase A/oxoprolinase/acetone carboxylase beta subunit